MSRFEKFAHNLRESVDGLAEGWQDLWQKARNAVTRFTPFQDEAGDNHPLLQHSSRWGVMSAELREADDVVEVQLEAPGMDRKDFDIDVDGRYLSVRGRKHYRSDRREGRYHITERAYGNFERVIPLPCEVTPGKATYVDGVLTVTLPKQEKSHVKRITVE
jgi:HSP20 family protein